jgi:hypothetical protein
MKQEIIKLLQELCHADTWEGVNKYNARALFESYADRIIKLQDERFHITKVEELLEPVFTTMVITHRDLGKALDYLGEWLDENNINPISRRKHEQKHRKA